MPGEPGATAAPEDDAEALEDIQRALEADAKAREEKGASGAAAPPSTTSPAASPSASASAAAFLPDIAVTGDFALAAFSADEPLQTGGHDPTENGFHLQQLELVLGKAVDPYFRFDAVLVFAQVGVEIEEAYGTTLALPAGLQLRAGQFLTRFGRINAQHLHAWNFVDQPFVIGRVFGGEGNRGLGAELSWLTPLPWFVELVGSVTSAAGEGTARSFFGAEDLGVDGPLDFQSTLVLEQFFPLSDDLSLLWGLSAATGPNASGPDNRTDLYGVDLYLKYRPLSGASTTVLSLQAEWLYRRRQLPGALLLDHGGYAEGFWRFAQRWGAAVRYELGTPARLAGAEERGPVDPLDPEWTRARHRVSASLSFLPTEFSRLRGQLGADAPRWREDVDLSAMLQLELTIGSHAAHKF